eukprot:UN09504
MPINDSGPYCILFLYLLSHHEYFTYTFLPKTKRI